jgi:hypothetical protein
MAVFVFFMTAIFLLTVLVIGALVRVAGVTPPMVLLLAFQYLLFG